MPDLSQSLREAWIVRANEATAILAHAQAAPALFKPEYVAQVEADRARALAMLTSSVSA